MNSPRQFHDPQWKHAIDAMDKLSLKLPWANRLRHPYYFSFKRNFKNGVKLYFSHWVEAFLFFFKHFGKIFLPHLPAPSPKEKGSNAPILILLDNNTAYLNALLPLVKSLQQNNRAFECFIPKDKQAAVLKRLQQENISEVNLLDEDFFLPKNYFTSFFKADFKSRLDLLKWIFGNTKKKFFLFQHVWQYALQQHLYSNSIQQFLQTKKYLLGAGDHWFWDSLFYFEASKTDCQSIILQHGLMGEFNYPMHSKKYWVWGKHDYDVMLNDFKANAKELEIIGSAHFDTFAQKLNITQKTFERKSITFFTQPYFKYEALGTGLYTEVVNWFYELNAVAQKHNKQLLIKWHQLDNESLYPKFSDEIKTSKNNLAEVLAETCIGITVDSAIMFEAASADVPMIQLHHPNFERFIDFSKDGLTLKASSLNELQALIEKLLSDENYFNEVNSNMQKSISQFLANKNEVLNEMLKRLK